MGCVGCVRCEKFRRDYVARTFELVRPVLHRVSCGNQTVPNAPKWYKTHQNVSLGSNRLDRVCSLRKIPTRLRGTNFCTSSARFAPSFAKRSQIQQNISLGSNGVNRVRSLRKIPTRLRARTFPLVQPVLHRVS